jgi:hypothetical protein
LADLVEFHVREKRLPPPGDAVAAVALQIIAAGGWVLGGV